MKNGIIRNWLRTHTYSDLILWIVILSIYAYGALVMFSVIDVDFSILHQPKDQYVSAPEAFKVIVSVMCEVIFVFLTFMYLIYLLRTYGNKKILKD